MKHIKVLQIDSKKENAHFRMFESLESLQRHKLNFNFNYYKIVYDGMMDNVENPEDVYKQLQFTKPKGYKGHSLSVSDIVVMDGKFLFCNSFGFVDVTDKCY